MLKKWGLCLLLLVSACQSETQQEDVIINNEVEAKKAQLSLTTQTIRVEYGSKDVDPLHWVKGGYWNELTFDKVDTNRMGKQEIVYHATIDDDEVMDSIIIEVVDTKPPVFKDGLITIDLNQNDVLDASRIRAVDPIDGRVDVMIQGRVDTSVVGRQHIRVAARDKHFNISEKTVTLVIHPIEQLEQDENSYQETILEPIDYVIEQHEDSNISNGTTVVSQIGEVGLKNVTYLIVEGEEEIQRTVFSEEILLEPQNEIILVGTGPLCPQAVLNEEMDCYYFDERLVVDTLGHRVPLFKTEQEANTWGQEQANMMSWHGCQDFLLKDVQRNDGTIFYYASMRACP